MTNDFLQYNFAKTTPILAGILQRQPALTADAVASSWKQLEQIVHHDLSDSLAPAISDAMACALLVESKAIECFVSDHEEVERSPLRICHARISLAISNFVLWNDELDPEELYTEEILAEIRTSLRLLSAWLVRDSGSSAVATLNGLYGHNDPQPELIVSAVLANVRVLEAGTEEHAQAADSLEVLIDFFASALYRDCCNHESTASASPDGPAGAAAGASSTPAASTSPSRWLFSREAIAGLVAELVAVIARDALPLLGLQPLSTASITSSASASADHPAAHSKPTHAARCSGIPALIAVYYACNGPFAAEARKAFVSSPGAPIVMKFVHHVLDGAAGGGLPGGGSSASCAHPAAQACSYRHGLSISSTITTAASGTTSVPQHRDVYLEDHVALCWPSLWSERSGDGTSSHGLTPAFMIQPCKCSWREFITAAEGWMASHDAASDDSHVARVAVADDDGAAATASADAGTKRKREGGDDQDEAHKR